MAAIADLWADRVDVVPGTRDPGVPADRAWLWSCPAPCGRHAHRASLAEAGKAAWDHLTFRHGGDASAWPRPEVRAAAPFCGLCGPPPRTRSSDVDSEQ